MSEKSFKQALKFKVVLHVAVNVWSMFTQKYCRIGKELREKPQAFL